MTEQFSETPLQPKKKNIILYVVIGIVVLCCFCCITGLIGQYLLENSGFSLVNLLRSVI
jgi:purine-cytosine permease-like protein